MLLTGNHNRTLSESTTVSNEITLSKVAPTPTIIPPRTRLRSLSIEDSSSTGSSSNSSSSSNNNNSCYGQNSDSSSSSDDNSNIKATHTNVAVTTTCRCQMDGSIHRRSAERGASTNTNDDTTLGSSSTSSSFGNSNDLSFGTQTDVLVKRYHQRRQRAAVEAAAAAVADARTVSLPNSVSTDQKIQPLENKEGPPSPIPQQLHPQAATMKRHRRDKTATSAMVGAGVGTLLLPVIGTVVGGFLSGYAANRSLKKYEKKVQRKWEREQFQRDANASQVAQNAVFV